MELDAQRPPEQAPAAVGVEPEGSDHRSTSSTRAHHTRTGTRRITRRWAPRPTRFTTAAGSWSDFLAGIDQGAERVYVVDGWPDDPIRWEAGGVPDGWTRPARPAYVAGSAAVLTAVRPDGRKVEVVDSSAWFGTGLTVEQCEQGWRELVELVGSAFPDGTLLTSPGATGRALWGQSIPWDHEWPILSDELQELIRSTTGQGRIELCWQGGELPSLVNYDGRFMYSALCWGLPNGEPVRDHLDEFAGKVPGRYDVSFRAPADWDHVGIIPVRGSDGWEWPTSGRAWCDGSELDIALRYGWSATIHERLIWPNGGRGPLDTWALKLRRLRADAQTEGARRGVRAILLHAVGAFHGQTHRVTRTGTLDQVPEGADGWHVTRDGVHVWTEHQPQAWPELAHPEWSAAVWARARARLLDAPTGTRGVRAGVLHLPRSEVVGFRTDAIYLTSDPGWPDDGDDGRFRIRAKVPGPLPAPASSLDLVRMTGA